MAIHVSAQLITGLSTDTKPTNVPYGIAFVETDTLSTFRFTPLGWVGAHIAFGEVGIGYGLGTGGTVTQQTSKSTAVTIDALCGEITTNNQQILPHGQATFTVNNALVDETDIIPMHHISGGTIGHYLINTNTIADGSFKVSIESIGTGPQSEALVLRFVIIRTVTS
jgi:hypothetical protein